MGLLFYYYSFIDVQPTPCEGRLDQADKYGASDDQ